MRRGPLLLVLGVLLAGCGGGGHKAAQADPPATVTAATTPVRRVVTIKRLVPVAAGNLGERDPGCSRRTVRRRRGAARRSHVGRHLVGRDRHRDARGLAACRPDPDGAARLGRRHDRRQHVSLRRRHRHGADRHDRDGRSRAPVRRRRSGTCRRAVRTSPPRPSAARRTSSAGTPVRTGSTRSSPGRPAARRMSSRTCRTRCATPRQRRSADAS